MASAIRVSWNWLKMAWSTQPILVVATAMGVAGELGQQGRVRELQGPATRLYAHCRCFVLLIFFFLLILWFTGRYVL